MKKNLLIISAVAVLTACGTGKTVQNGDGKPSATVADREKGSVDFLRKLTDNAVYSRNIVAPINFTLSTKDRNISVSGKLQMRKDEVIRITLSPFGLMEVGRIEFTPDYVMLVDRVNKEYVQATYSDLDFLKRNGMNFYTLQALFWNELFVPSKQTLSDSDLSGFEADMLMQNDRPVTLKAGDLHFSWTTDVQRCQIKSAAITYRKGTSQQSEVSFKYDAFAPVGVKKFPSKETISFNSSAAGLGKVTLDMEMSRIGTDDKWETRTKVADRYKRLTVQQVMKLVGLLIK